MTKGSRELQLNKRDQFFSDPVFKDILAYDDKSLQTKLNALKARNLNSVISTQPNLRGEAAHNLQVTVSNDKFMIQLELPGFWPEDFNLKTKDDVIILEAVHEGRSDDEFTARKYTKEFHMPEGVQASKLTSSYSAEGILTIEAPRLLEVPEGASVQEALAANSRAYTTDEGRTSVNEKSSASSQVINAVSESPDGRTKSSMTFSSSSSSASSVISSAGDPRMSNSMIGGNQFPSLAMGMPRMPQMSLDMDSMMKQMMGQMSLGGMDSISQRMNEHMSLFNKDDFFSSTSSANHSAIGRGFNRPNLDLDLGRVSSPGIDIEELSNAGSDISAGPPTYTVTSPPPTAKKSGNFSEVSATHTVKPTSDYTKAKASKKSGEVFNEEADCTVLLKLKEGDEYKLVLNMQQYSPDNITVKLNDRDLTIMAHEGNTEDFFQRHKIPEGIDLEQLTSSFSSDGILVVKAPRLKSTRRSK